MAAGIIPVTSIPGWPQPDPALPTYCQNQLIAAGFPPTYSFAPDGLHVSDVPTVNAAFSSLSGSQGQLQFYKDQKQNALDALLLNNFNLISFIMAGNATPVTANQIGTFLATITTNYRTLRASITAATTVAQVQAININAGWPES